MSGGFFRVDMTKVKMDVIRPWIATRVTELLGFEDEVLINFVYGLLEDVDGKKIQIQLTGFVEKNTGKFMKELWGLLLSVQNNVIGDSSWMLKRRKQRRKRRKQIELLRKFRRGEIGMEGSLNERERVDLMV
ncbi:PWI domain-containing protein C825.05c-like isoform X4 [Asparagus officinalis]|uniref:PWI domain-containing protein C825.05c-like isoform X4 n=1 Tax=Asparagus officinalis TaxID=4686 RepID=UPI00098DE78A|nr:PWI domain-containing protein C825.05c-like isoform X4 [Asparagus officinalis]